MNQSQFLSLLEKSTRPIVVDLWAPWCAPCQAMEPTFKQISGKYSGQVDVIKINADESPEVLRLLKVMSIPTVLAFSNGKEIVRRTGIQSSQALDVIFDAALNQRKPIAVPLAPMDRLLRVGGGLALFVLGLINGPSLLLFGLAGILLFSAIYDRCPIYRAIAPRVAEFFRKS